MPELEGIYGPDPLGIGTRGPIRLDQLSGVVISRGQLTYSEMVARGLIWTAANTAGLAPGTALTATPTFALHNPINSGVNLHLQRFTMAWTSGTLGAGKLWHCFHPLQATLPTGTLVTPLNNLGGYTVTGQRAKVFSTITAGLVAPTQGIRIAGTVTALAADAGTGPPPIDDKLDGDLIVPPGGTWSPQEIGGAGTSPLVFFSIAWKELMVPPQQPMQ
jgi:hypothetical protein